MIVQIPAHVLRMRDELAELDDRRNKLDAFINGHILFRTLDGMERVLMVDQLLHMDRYSRVLSYRLDRALNKLEVEAQMLEDQARIEVSEREALPEEEIPHSGACLAPGGVGDEDCICGAHEKNLAIRAQNSGKDYTEGWPFLTSDRADLKQ